MKYILIIIFLFIGYKPIIAQTVISLDEQWMLDKTDQDYPADLTYIKDINHRLDSLSGNWKGFSQGRSYEIIFTKLENVYLISPPSPGAFRRDRLIGRLLVKDSVTNNVIYNSLNVSDDKANFRGVELRGPRVYYMFFGGPENGCYDYGDVFIGLRLNDPTVMLLTYYGDGDLADPSTCPGGLHNYRRILPAKLLLQKQ